MPEPVTTTSAVIKTGAMLASGGLMADLIIFNDGFYQTLAIVGALVSMFGVLHEVLSTRPIEHTIPQIAVEMAKGLVLGVLAIPFWFLLLSSSGEAIVERLFQVTLGQVANSFWLIISFAASWYTVPIFDWIVEKIKRKGHDV